MLKLLLLGTIVGGAIAALARSDVSEDETGPIADLKRQAHAALRAGKEEAAAKEAEMLREYEKARQGRS